MWPLAVVALASGCVVGGHGWDSEAIDRGVFTASGFAHKDYKLRVSPGSNSGEILGPNWILDNYYRRDGELKPRDGEDYLSHYSLDLNGDGTFESTVTEYRFLLRYKHAEHDGVIWLRALPLSPDERRKELKSLMRTYVDGVAGAGYEAVSFGGPPQVVERRYAAEIVAASPARVGGHEAYAATVDVANVDQLKLSPTRRKTRVGLVLIRTTFWLRVSGEVNYPVLLVTGYSNQPDDYPRAIAEYQSFLGRIDFGQGGSFEGAALSPSSPDPGAATPPSP